MDQLTSQTYRCEFSANIRGCGDAVTACVPTWPLGTALACRAPLVRLDQFYTKTHIAARLYATFRRFYDPAASLMVEPSAAGALFSDYCLPAASASTWCPRRPAS